MNLVMAGINHNSAPLEVREYFSLHEKEIKEAVPFMLKQKGIKECLLFSTCNRTEFYAWSEGNEDVMHAFSAYFKEIKKIESRFLQEKIFYTLEEVDAVRHLFRVACGLDSTVLGETQVLGQIKDAYLVCQEEEACGNYVNGLAQKALSTGKRAHTETEIGQHAVSFGYASAELARQNFSELHDKTMVVIGTGEMAKLTLQNIFDLGIKEVVIASHYPGRAEQLASRFQGKTINLTEIDSGLGEADVVICATNAPHYVVTEKRVQSALLAKERKDPLLLVDLGMPRNVEPVAGEISGVKLFNLDDVNQIIQENLNTRRQEARKVEVVIEEEIEEYMRWYRRQKVNPFIAELRSKADSIRQEKLDEFESQLSSLSSKEKRAVEKLTRSIMNSLLKDPVMNMKDISLTGEYETAEIYARKILGLRENNDAAEETHKMETQKKR